MNTVALAAGIGAALGALGTDLHAYSQSEGGFNWRKCLARVFAAGIAGYLGAASVSGGAA